MDSPLIDDSICKPGCRFWPETGRIEALEILGKTWTFLILKLGLDNRFSTQDIMFL